MPPYYHIFNNKIPEQILIWENVKNGLVDLGNWQHNDVFCHTIFHHESKFAYS